MYLRKSSRKNNDGSIVTYYQLAHNERHPVTRKPVSKILHTFGRADKIDREALVRLCRSIARVCEVDVIDRHADCRQPTLFKDQCGEEIQFIKTTELGTIMIIDELWQRLGIKESLKALIKDKGTQSDYERALFLLTANRLCEPLSKLGTWSNWKEKVYLPSCAQVSLHHLYEAMDFLFDHAAQVEKSVFFHTANLLNLEVDLIFYDTTTASFAIDYEDVEEEDGEPGLRKFGHSKEGVWTPQVVVALAVTREGLPVRCWVFPGNTSDAKTIEHVRADLRGWKLGRALFVADSGMNSQENRRELSRACGKYLLASRMASVSQVKKEVLSKRGRYTAIKDNLMAKEVIVGDGERRTRYVLCYNPKEAKRQKLHRQELIKQLEEALSCHKNHQVTCQWAIDLLASRRYKRYLTITKGRKLRIDRQAVRDSRRYDGKWVIETNDDTISFEDAACGYKGLMVIERCFRSLKKTQIKMTPMYHWAPRRIEAHIRICVLALLIQRVAEMECRDSWFNIRKELGKLQATECRTKNHVFFKRNEVSERTKEIFKSLKTPLPKSLLRVSDVGIQA